MSRPQSSLGECLASMMAREDGDLLIALHSYFDGSYLGKSWTDGDFVTLAGYATDDIIWTEFDRVWKEILATDTRRPKAPYLHMKEARALEGPFNFRNGWNHKKVGYLIYDLLEYAQTLPKDKFHQFACTIDIAAYGKLLNEGYELDGIIEICNDFCPKAVLYWYFDAYPGVMGDLHYFFDVSEPFEPIFKEQLRSRKSDVLGAHGMDYVWTMIQSVTTTDMRKRSPLQLSDLLAWGTNRKLSPTNDAVFKEVEPIMKQIIPSDWVVFDEAKLRKEFRTK